MLKISLEEYKTTSQYLHLFDAIIKDKIVLNRDAFLESLKINPSTYRRTKESEGKSGIKIVNKLTCYFGLSTVKNDFITSFEKLVNNIIFEVEYKVFEKYEKHLNILEDLLNKNLIIYPILKLLKVYLNIFSDKNITRMKEENRNDFIELEKYYKFFNIHLKEIYDLIKLVYYENYMDEMLTKKYVNGIGYSIISINYKRKNDYYKSLYFANKAKETFLKENNFKRAIYMNNTILNDLVSIGDYNEYYELANKLHLTIRSLGMGTRDRINCMKHRLTSCIALRKFDEVLEICSDRNLTNMTELFCYIIAQYFILKKDFNSWFDNYIIGKVTNIKCAPLVDSLISFLNKPEKKKLELCRSDEVLEGLVIVLSKLYC